MTSDRGIPTQKRGILVGVILLLALGSAAFGANLAIGNESSNSVSTGESVAAEPVAAQPTAFPSASSARPAPSSTARTDWPTNGNGETYGSSALAKSYDDVPDLVHVMATNGKVGYAFRASLDSPPTTLAADSVNEANLRGWEVPVYEADGVTQVGVFTVGGPGSEIGGTRADGTSWKMVSNADGTTTTTVTAPDGAVTVSTE